MDLSKEKISKLPVFFIIGRPRSGTTLLRTILDAHPNIKIPTECFFILQLFRKYNKVKNWDDNKIQCFLKDLRNTRFYKVNSFDDKSIYNDLLAAKGENDYQSMCKIVIMNYQSIFLKEEIMLLGDKNPFYSFFFSNVFSIFRDAKFIHIVRDYRDNYISIFNARFENPSLVYNVLRWKKSIRTIDKLKNAYPAQFYTLRYEDLVADSTKYLKEICLFLNIPFHDELLDFYKYKDKFKEKYPLEILDRIHKNLFTPISAENVGIWSETLSEKDIALADYVAGTEGEKYGYKKNHEKKNLWKHVKVIPGYLLHIFTGGIYGFAMYLPLWWQKRFFNNFHRITGSIFYNIKKKL